MRLETQKYLDDMQRAAGLLAEFTSGKSSADYEQDAMMRAMANPRRLVSA